MPPAGNQPVRTASSSSARASTTSGNASRPAVAAARTCARPPRARRAHHTPSGMAMSPGGRGGGDGEQQRVARAGPEQRRHRLAVGEREAQLAARPATPAIARSARAAADRARGARAARGRLLGHPRVEPHLGEEVAGGQLRAGGTRRARPPAAAAGPGSRPAGAARLSHGVPDAPAPAGGQRGDRRRRARACAGARRGEQPRTGAAARRCVPRGAPRPRPRTDAISARSWDT